MRQDLAQILAIRALGWLAGEEELWLGFLGHSGAEPAQVRAAVARAERGVLVAGLDYLLLSDAWVLACAAALALRPEELVLARGVLAGAGGMHWT